MGQLTLAFVDAIKPGILRFLLCFFFFFFHKGLSDFHLVIEEIFNIVPSFTFVSWSFVKRSWNRVAHELAHFQ